MKTQYLAPISKKDSKNFRLTFFLEENDLEWTYIRLEKKRSTEDQIINETQFMLLGTRSRPYPHTMTETVKGLRGFRGFFVAWRIFTSYFMSGRKCVKKKSVKQFFFCFTIQCNFYRYYYSKKC
jgi:hypothetical protein